MIQFSRHRLICVHSGVCLDGRSRAMPANRPNSSTKNDAAEPGLFEGFTDNAFGDAMGVDVSLEGR
jgi:hypothetical protein